MERWNSVRSASFARLLLTGLSPASRLSRKRPSRHRNRRCNFEHYELVKCVTEKPAKIGFRSRYSLRLYSWAKKARLDRNQAPFIGAASTSAAYFNSILRLPEPLPNCASGVVLKGGIQIFFSRKKHRCRIGFSAQSELCERAFPGTPIQVDLPRSRRLHSKCLGDPPGSGYRISKLGTSKRLGTA